jgi:hypothetical protein
VESRRLRKELSSKSNRAAVVASQAQWTFDNTDRYFPMDLCPLFLFLARATHLRVAGDVFWQELDGDEAMQAGVLGLIDNAHAAASQLLDNPVVRDGLADHGRICLIFAVQKYPDPSRRLPRHRNAVQTWPLRESDRAASSAGTGL